MKLKLFAVTLMALALSACASVPVPQTTLAACKSLKSVTIALTQVKPLMTPAIAQSTFLALETAATICMTPTPPANSNAAVAAILNSLNTLTQVLAQAKQGAPA